MRLFVIVHDANCKKMQLLPLLSWLEPEAVNLKVGSLSLPGSVSCMTA